jgi:hypothetical protein
VSQLVSLFYLNGVLKYHYNAIRDASDHGGEGGGLEGAKNNKNV